MQKSKQYWFRSTWMGSATPIHPMGVLTLFGGVGAAFGLGFGGDWLMDHGFLLSGKICWGGFVIWIIILLILMQSRTEPRR